jgi:hypothetical protein
VDDYAPSQWRNLGKVQNRGLELAVNADIVRAALLTWSVRVNGSWLKNKLVDAGNADLGAPQGARNVVGYPLFGLWDRPILSYKDANGDGVLTEDEIVVGDAPAFKGSTLPTREGGLTSTVGLFRDRLRVSATLDYRGGFYNQWQYEYQRCQTGNCRAVNDSHAPLADQAAAVAASSATLGQTLWGYFQPNDFVRFRELSVAYNLPARLAHHVGPLQSATVVLSGRNLGTVWTRFPGVDPEANVDVANTGGGNSDYYAFPPSRYWLVRVNLGL